MSDIKQNGLRVLQDRINAELQDSVDEELEMELDDERLDQMLAEVADRPESAPLDRHLYLRELLELQRELVKLQDWVQHHRQKVVVIFEGRDSAGKGGVIKRITQRLNPRSAASPRSRPRTSASAPGGTSSVTWRICRPEEKSCCSTAAGTTAPASSG
jgi:polyphosphate kinase 2 (PPK2 family)